jgi:hypothetical protein
MSSKKMKALYRLILGDTSRRGRRRYLRIDKTGQIINAPEGPRGRYLAAKRLAKRKVTIQEGRRA